MKNVRPAAALCVSTLLLLCAAAHAGLAQAPAGPMSGAKADARAETAALIEKIKAHLAEAQKQGLAAAVVQARVYDEIEVSKGKQRAFRVATMGPAKFSDGTVLPFQSTLHGTTVPTDASVTLPDRPNMTIEITDIEGPHKKLIPVTASLLDAVDMNALAESKCPPTKDCYPTQQTADGRVTHVGSTDVGMPTAAPMQLTKHNFIPGAKVIVNGNTLIISSNTSKAPRIDTGTVLTMVLTKPMNEAVH